MTSEKPANSESNISDFCGTVVTPEQAAYELSILEKGGLKSVKDRDSVYYVPVSFHIVRRTDGSGGMLPERLHLAMQNLNIMYQPVGIQFYRLRADGGDEYALHFIDDDNYYYNTDNNGMYDALRQESPVPNTINVYYVPNFPYCGLSVFTSYEIQGILMNPVCDGTDDFPSTLAHEIGHYFDLYHTHETYFGTECPDSSNCAVAGDLICDTPADPLLTGLVNSNCEYTGSVDPPPGCGGTYDPQVDNLMSYSTKICRDYWTPMQIDKMIYTLVNLRPELITIDSTDTDGDGIFDFLDNCVFTSNSEQTDTDNDYWGDICDFCPQDHKNDKDGDGYCAAEDNCPTVYNPHQLDSDGNGIGDKCVCTDGIYRFTGDSSDVFGWKAKSAGDVNNDGYDDIIVSAVYNSITDDLAGRVYVYSGIDGSVLFDLRGEAAVDIFGTSVSGVGDVNNDGIDDMMVGAYLNDANGISTGRAYLFYGDDTGPYPIIRNASGADRTYTGETEYAYLGYAVSGLGDIDNDEYDDYLIAAYNGGPDYEGIVYVYSGQTGALLYTVGGAAHGDGFGYSVSGAGLIDTDTIPDFIVGAPFNDFVGDAGGMAYVYSGVDGSLIYSKWGSWSGERFGHAVSGVGDVNNDGRDDFIISAPYSSNGNSLYNGKAVVYSGATGNAIHTIYGFEGSDLFGWSVSDIGDINSDGYNDFVVGASWNDFSSDMSGSAYVFSGIDGTVFYEVSGEEAFDRFGADVSGKGDINADGINDLIVGAYNYAATGGQYTGSGRAYVYLIGDDDIDGYQVGCDNCPIAANPGQEDYDHDGIGDACDMLCGDANNDEAVNIIDITYLIAFLYQEGPPPVSQWAANANGDGAINILDITYLIAFLYQEGPEPVCL